MIEFKDLSLEFPDFRLGPLSLRVESESFFSLMGPTGSGKTLLLEFIAGLIKPDHGTISVDNRDITHEPSERRGVGLVYQDNALFPHMNVFENITYGQRYNQIGIKEGARYAHELMEMLSISDLETRKPETLSGGEKQRTALARALACLPDIVLLDEPLSSLDPQFREGLRRNLKLLHKETGALFFMVTHDFVDALTLSDSAAVIRYGVIEQSGPTLDIFHHPETTFIADFVGMKNIFAARYENGSCFFADHSIPVRDLSFSENTGHAALRPEDIEIVDERATPPGWPKLQGTIETVLREGFSWLAIVRCHKTLVTVRIEQRLLLNGLVRENNPVTLSYNPDSVHHILT